LDFCETEFLLDCLVEEGHVYVVFMPQSAAPHPAFVEAHRDPIFGVLPSQDVGPSMVPLYYARYLDAL